MIIDTTGSLLDDSFVANSTSAPSNSTASGKRFLARGKGSSSQAMSNVNSLIDVLPFNVVMCMILLIIAGFSKILYFLRLFDDYGFIVEMVGETIK